MSDEELKALFEGLRQENAAAHLETRRHFEATAERLEAKFDTLAETVAHLDERLGREVNRLEEKMDRGFAETQTMIKFSYAELDRRIRALEEGFAGLQSRLERLESSTH